MPWSTTFTRIVSVIFGCMLLIMSVMISIEIVSRKLLGFSLQGADEISGYIMAVISCLAAGVAVIGRTHVRIDILYGKMSRKLKAVLNFISSVSIAVFAVILTYTAYPVVLDSIEYNSTAPTPLSTPLVYPMVPWLLALVVFTVVSAIYALKAVRLALKGDIDGLNEEFKPKAQKEELKEEVDAARKRGVGTGEDLP